LESTSGLQRQPDYKTIDKYYELLDEYMNYGVWTNYLFLEQPGEGGHGSLHSSKSAIKLAILYQKLKYKNIGYNK